jgi:hypothetical protein
MPQEDQHATELNHPEKVSRVTFPAAADPAKVLQRTAAQPSIAAGSGAAAAHPGFAFGGDGWGAIIAMPCSRRNRSSNLSLSEARSPILRSGKAFT